MVSLRAPNGAGGFSSNGYYRHTIDGRRDYEHRLLAAKALGKPLPPGACVHHANGVPYDNAPGNLVLCPDAEYHRLLHERMKARARSWRRR
jgi:hypothetical protein